jgi:hypothetical protein
MTILVFDALTLFFVLMECALGYNAIILCGTVNRSRLRDGGVGGSISRARR